MPPTSAHPIALRSLALYYLFLIPAWVAAWYLHGLTSIKTLPPSGQAAYWTLAKLVIWIAPILFIVTRVLQKAPATYLGLVRFRHALRVGLAIGIVFIALAAAIDVFTRSHAVPVPTWGTLTALTVAPLFEEVMFRGFALQALHQSRIPFWPANLIAAFLFLGLHVPGWIFMGGFHWSHLIAAPSIVIIGLVAGYAKRRANSTWAAVIFHFVNNAYSTFVR